MKDEHILQFLLEWMAHNGASEAQQAEYAGRWKELGPHESRPCPRCFFTEVGDLREQPLAPLRAEGRAEPLFCPHCKTKFAVPEPD